MFNLHLIKVILSEDKIIIKYIYQMVEYLYLNSKVLKNFYTNKTIFYVMDKKSSVDVDTLEDFKVAKNYIKK